MEIGMVTQTMGLSVALQPIQTLTLLSTKCRFVPRSAQTQILGVKMHQDRRAVGRNLAPKQLLYVIAVHDGRTQR